MEVSSDLYTQVFLLEKDLLQALVKQMKNLVTMVQTQKNNNQSKIQTIMLICGIVWKSNATVSPWMAGSWESLIRLSNRVMKNLINNKTYHEKLIITIICETECILNGMPLLLCSDDLKL